jgi:hypothetical protein
MSPISFLVFPVFWDPLKGISWARCSINKGRSK